MSGFAEFDQYDGVGLAELVRRREVKPEEVLDAAIARVEARILPSTRWCPVCMTRHVRRLAWGAAGRTIHRGAVSPQGPLGALHRRHHQLRQPVFRRLPCRPRQRDHRPPQACRPRDLRQDQHAGARALPSTEPRLFGATRNPWNPSYSAGGSSGGAAAAVAAGMLPMAHATDGAGSIRIPSSCCGLVGLKPTRARNPLGPDQGEGWGGASVAHAVTRTVRDSAALLDATSGARRWRSLLGTTARRAVSTRGWPRARSTADCLHDSALERAARRSRVRRSGTCRGKAVRELGHHVEEARPEIDEASLGHATRIIIGANIRAALEARAEMLGRALSADDVESVTWARAVDGRTYAAADYARAMGVVHRTGRVVARFFIDYDVLLSPTLCQPPYPLGVLDMMRQDSEAYLDALRASVGFTSLFSSAGNPAISLPLAWSKAGLPLGVQFAARFGDEATLFRLAAQFEVAQPWADRRPALASPSTDGSGERRRDAGARFLLTSTTSRK